MTVLNKRSFEISAYTNPCSDKIEDDLDLYDVLMPFLEEENRARVEAGAAYFLKDPEDDTVGMNLPLEEALQINYPSRLTAGSPKITLWHNTITSWMPKVAEKWWLDEFGNGNEHLDPMTEEWWRLRARNWILAHEKGDISKPLGAVALTKIHVYERAHSRPLSKNGFFFEIRGLVVDESHRGKGIGRALMIAALRAAAEAGESLPTVAVTKNKAAAAVFQTIGGKTEASEDYPYKGGDLYRSFLCWSAFETGPLPCDACPKYNDTAWWWPTHRNSVAELGIPDEQLNRVVKTIEIPKDWLNQPVETTQITRLSEEF